MHWSDKLVDLGACEEAVEWARSQESPETAWHACERADWMLWVAAKICDHKTVVLAACDCAETVLDLIQDGSTQMMVMLCLYITREWCAGREDLTTVKAARWETDAAAYAAYAAAYAAAAADAAADAAAYAAYAREQALKHMADLVRARIPEIGAARWPR